MLHFKFVFCIMISALKTEAVNSSKTLVQLYHFMRRDLKKIVFYKGFLTL